MPKPKKYDHRGSLRQCLEAMMCRWRINNSHYQVILHNATSNYYCLIEDRNLQRHLDAPTEEGLRIVLRVTESESKAILAYYQNTQTEMELNSAIQKNLETRP